MEVVLYNFAKSENSTAIPSGGTSYNCILKTPTSVLNPVIVVEANVLNVTYGYIPDFGRYYFVFDIVSVNNSTWELHLHVDVLATYKSEILSTEAYIARATYGNTNIPDNLIVGMSQYNITDVDSGAGISGQPGFILSVIDCVNGGSGSGAATMYYMTDGQLGALLRAMYTPAMYEDKISDALVKSLFNPYQYIVSCCYHQAVVPVNPRSIGLGFTDSGVGGSDTSIPYNNGHVVLSVGSKHGDFRDFEPYTYYIVYIPYCGAVRVPPSSLGSADTIAIQTCTDYTSGAVECVIRAGSVSGAVIAKVTGSLGFQVPLAQLNNGGALGSFISGAVNSVAGGLTTNPALVGKGVMDFIDCLSFAPSMIGSSGSSAGSIWGVTCHVYKAELGVSAEPNSISYTKGNPSCKVAQIDTCGHYVEALDPHISISGYDQEREEIVTKLAGGVYIE